jgi:hypothetical protein
MGFKMRFFTKEWLTGALPDADFDTAPKAYQQYLATLQLPSDAIALSRADIHDALVLDVKFDPSRRHLVLRLRSGDLQRGYSDIHIAYSEAAIDSVSLGHLRQVMQPPRKELLQDEVDRIERRLEHRLIFENQTIPRSFTEVSVLFAAVAIHSQPVRGRDQP